MFLPSLDILCFDRMISGEVNVAADAGHGGARRDWSFSSYNGGLPHVEGRR